MRISLIILFSLYTSISIAQENIKIFAEKKGSSFVLYASNSAYCPMSVSLDLNLENMRFSEGGRKIFLLNATIDKLKIGELDIINPGMKYSYSFKYLYNYGDVALTKYDTAYEYTLPYQNGKSFKVFQGYNGNFSHQNENSLDFTMPEGTEIVAAREGTVVSVVQNNAESCPKEECKKYNNYIIVYHADGTFSSYVHLKLNGSKVKAGDVITKGQLIAYSGNTGWSSGPHLHFNCWLPAFEKRRTVPTLFKINNSSNAVLLQEKETYLKEN